MIYNILVHLHSGVRWILLISIILAFINAFLKLRTKALANCKDCVFNRLSMIFAHIQLVVGLVLYFISPKVIFTAASMKDGLLRFFLVEHIAIMLIAITLITIGYLKSEKADEDLTKYKSILVYYGIALVLVILAMPWPFRNLGAGWY